MLYLLFLIAIIFCNFYKIYIMAISANHTLEDEKYNVTTYHTYNRMNDSSYYNTNIIYISFPHQPQVPRVDQHYLIQRHFM
jgi:hypothetical protein